MEATFNIFQNPREYGSEEWNTFRIVRNDLRPLTRFFRTAVENHFKDESHDTPAEYYSLNSSTMTRVSRERQLADIQEAYNS